MEKVPLEIVIPIYNEGEKVIKLLNQFQVIIKTRFKVLLCYDLSNDNIFNYVNVYYELKVMIYNYINYKQTLIFKDNDINLKLYIDHYNNITKEIKFLIQILDFYFKELFFYDRVLKPYFIKRDTIRILFYKIKILI